jgi:hypothetical protein
LQEAEVSLPLVADDLSAGETANRNYHFRKKSFLFLEKNFKSSLFRSKIGEIVKHKQKQKIVRIFAIETKTDKTSSINIELKS